MEKEISSGTMLGIVLIALAAVIGIGFGVFSIARGQANDGVSKMQTQIDAIGQSAFLDYDQHVVTGTQVLSAYKNFEGKPVAILVNTKALRDGQAVSTQHTTTYLVGTSTDKYINYNALLAENTSSALGSYISGGGSLGDLSGSIPQITMDNASYKITTGFATSSGEIVYDTIIGGMYKKGNAEYITSDSKFMAYLLKDESKTIVLGLVFKQI